MIAVIADDYTGAAEIGGIGLRHGLNVVIETMPENGEKADLLIVATDTRSMNPEEASVKIAQITKQLIKLNPDFIFKKVDSVLRGNIIKELNAQMEVTGKKRCVLIAANPIFKRIIQNGKYLIDNVPLNETSFASDPQFPINSSNVTDIVSESTYFSVINLKHNDALPENGIIIGDVTNIEDLNNWTKKLDKDTMLAGASGFFNALLEYYTGAKLIKKRNQIDFNKKTLVILGSTYPKNSSFYNTMKHNDYFLSNMKKELYYDESENDILITEWAEEIISNLKKCDKVVAYINHLPLSGNKNTCRIKNIVGRMVKKVLQITEIDDLLIEGGSTTFQILDELGIYKLYPFHEIDTGVINMKLKNKWNFNITTKPGSYCWPDEIFVNNKTDKHKKMNITQEKA